MSKLDAVREEIRLRAEIDLPFFINLVHPRRVLGDIHIDTCRWWTRPEKKSHQLLLLPRDHQKSTLMAYRATQRIVKDPCTRIIYLSSTSNLAVKQLGFIKGILTSKVVQRYWPELIHPEETKREKWTESEISVDHPRRREESIRDPTIFTAGLTTNIVGMHCDVAALDDIVTDDTSLTEEGRERVKRAYSYLASVEATDAEEWVVGTRYDPKDLYNDMLQMTIEEFDDDGTLIREEPLYEVKQHSVEDQGDGTGEFLWPIQTRNDGKTFGFNQKILARKRAQYQDSTKFRAQYYNDPNDISTSGIKDFQYYDRQHLSQSNGKWFIQNKKLNVFASVDFAYSLSKKADYSSIVVVGIDADRNFYILDIDRFKTEGNVSDYYTHILRLHQKWDFRKIKAEVTVAQKTIVQTLKDEYIRRDGLALSIEEYRPDGREGTKAERIYNTLQPRYSNHQIWHYRGGNCQILEEELTLQKPAHDDVKDALASVIPMCVAPTGSPARVNMVNRNEMYHSRYGGIL